MRSPRRTAASDNTRAVSLKRGRSASTGDGVMAVITAHCRRRRRADIQVRVRSRASAGSAKPDEYPLVPLMHRVLQ